MTNVLLLRQIRRALESKSDHTVPEDFFLDMLDEQFSEEECLRQMETAVAWGRYAELFDFDAGRRRFMLPDAQEEETAAERGGGSEAPASSCRTLVTARTWPFFIDLAWPHAGWPSSLPSSAREVYWLGKPVPVVQISHSIRALPVYAFYSIVRMGLRIC